jgi:hypothetical protein
MKMYFMEKTAPFCLFYGNGYFFMEIGFTLWKLAVTFIEFRCISWNLVVAFMEISCHLWKFCVTGADETGPPLAPGRARRGRSESVGGGRGTGMFSFRIRAQESD